MSDFNPTPAQPASSGKSAVKIVLVIFGILGLCMVCCCGGGFGIFYFGLNAASSQVVDRFGTEPVVVEMIGGIDSASIDLAGTAEAQQEYGSEAIRFNVVGPEGRAGLIYINPDSGNIDDVEEAWLDVGNVVYPIFGGLNLPTETGVPGF